MFLNKMSFNAGALSGVIATFPMSAVMIMIKRSKPTPGEVAPEQLTNQIVGNSDIPSDVFKKRFLLGPLSWNAHFAYGLACGSFYSCFREIFPRNTPDSYVGSSYGFLIWLGSYWGWIPAAKLLPNPADTPARDNIARVIGHLVWGYTLAKCYNLLRPKQDDSV